MSPASLCTVYTSEAYRKNFTDNLAIVQVPHGACRGDIHQQFVNFVREMFTDVQLLVRQGWGWGRGEACIPPAAPPPYPALHFTVLLFSSRNMFANCWWILPQGKADTKWRVQYSTVDNTVKTKTGHTYTSGGRSGSSGPTAGQDRSCPGPRSSFLKQNGGSVFSVQHEYCSSTCTVDD